MPLRQVWAGEWVEAARRALMRIHLEMFMLEMLMAYSLVLDGGLSHPPFGVTKKIRVLREWSLTCLSKRLIYGWFRLDAPEPLVVRGAGRGAMRVFGA